MCLKKVWFFFFAKCSQLRKSLAEFLAVPLAAWLLPSYNANVYMGMLFSLMDASIFLMFTTISTVLYDAIRTLEDNWDEMIQAIETGNLPVIPSVEGHRVHLEVSVFSSYSLPMLISRQKYMKANPARANELRALEKGQEKDGSRKFGHPSPSSQ